VHAMFDELKPALKCPFARGLVQNHQTIQGKGRRILEIYGSVGGHLYFWRYVYGRSGLWGIGEMLCLGNAH
jgi:hypothetical protein